MRGRHSGRPWRDLRASGCAAGSGNSPVFCNPAELAQGRQARFVWAHAALDVLPRELLQVVSHFQIELALHGLAPEQRPEPKPEKVQDPHIIYAISTIRPTAPESRLQ